MRVDHAQRHDAQRGVSGQLRGDAAHPEEHERAEERIVGHADDQFDAGCRHRLDERAAHPIAEGGLHRVERGCRTASPESETQPDAADVGLVHEIPTLPL